MYVIIVAEVSFAAPGDEFNYIVSNLLFLAREYAKARNLIDYEASASPDRTISIERNKHIVRYRIFFNIRKEDNGRSRNIVDDYVSDFVSRMLQNAPHVTYTLSLQHLARNKS